MKCLKFSCGIFPLIAALAVMITAQGCFNSTLPNAPLTSPNASLTYPGPEEYANYGYINDPFIYAAYDPILYGFWCPPPYYFYWYNPAYYEPGCASGYCGPRGRKPVRPVYPWPLVAARTPADRAPNPARATAALAPSETPVTSQPTVSLNDDGPAAGGSHGEATTVQASHRGGFAGAGFSESGGGGSGGGHGSFHR
jgi:uncharacterized membrane protein YgcG